MVNVAPGLIGSMAEYLRSARRAVKGGYSQKLSEGCNPYLVKISAIHFTYGCDD